MIMGKQSHNSPTTAQSPVETLAAIITKFDVDCVSPFTKGIEADATVIETRAALAYFRARYGDLPWNMFGKTVGRA